MRSLHATAVAIEGEGVVLLGDSGVGKSDLALRLIDGGATLIADDQVMLSVEDGKLLASVAPSLAGIIELRGIGLLRVKYLEKAPVKLVIQCHTEAIDRLPEPSVYHHAGVNVPMISLHPLQAASTARVRAYLRALREGGVLPPDWHAGEQAGNT